MVAFLRSVHGLSHWWAQEITVDSEQYCGKRKIGETQTADYQIGVRKTIDGSVKEIWDYLMSPKGWLSGWDL
jgi:hypothetical protein